MSSVTGSIFAITISSPAFSQGGEIPAKYTCNGQSVSPELRISGAPSTAKSLALVVEDPDAPSGLFTHWLVWNISLQTTNFPENGVPAGSLQGSNDFSKRGYGAPCPPSGTHHYIFRVFALDQPIELKAGARRAQFDAAVKGHIVAQAELTGRYGH